MKKLSKKSSVILAVIFILIIMTIAIILNMKDNSEVLFKINNIYLTSSANGNYLDENDTKDWKLKLYQNNDVYIDFGVIENGEKINKKNSKIKEAYIEKFNIVEKPFLGTAINYYKLSQNSDKLFEYSDEYLINEKLQLNIVEENANPHKLEINKNGGQVALSIVNNNVGTNTYKGLDQISFDGTLLKGINATQIDIYFKVSFDLVIITEANNKYVSTITLDLPYGNIIDNGFELNEKVETTQMQFQYVK